MQEKYYSWEQTVKIPSVKPSSEKFQLNYKSFATQEKESSTPTDLLSVQQSWIQDESDVEHCMTKWITGFVKNLDFFNVDFSFSDQDISGYGLRVS